MFCIKADTKIINAEDAALPTNEGQATVQYVYVKFAHHIPKNWISLSNEECNWRNLNAQTKELMITELKDAILTENIAEMLFSFDPWGEDFFLNVYFVDGCAAFLYNAIDQYAIAPYNDSISIATPSPIEIGGQTPVPKMFTLDDLEVIIKVIFQFLEEGQLYPNIKWAKNDTSLPWEF